MEIDEKVGKLWHQYVSKKSSRLHTQDAVLFQSLAPQLKRFYHLMGGDKCKRLAMTDKRESTARRRFVEWFSAAEMSYYLAWQDDNGVYLPPSLAYFPDKTLNEWHYYWLVAMMTQPVVSPSSLKVANQQWIQNLCRDYAGFAQFYQAASLYLLNHYPEQLDCDNRDSFEQRQCYPNPLWVYPAPHQQWLLQPEDEDESVGRQQQVQQLDHLQMKKKVRRLDDRKKTDGLLLFLPEAINSFMEQVNVDRQENDQFDEHALYDAQALDEIALGSRDANLNARIKMHIEVDHSQQAYYPVGKGIYLDEWDYQRADYRAQYVRLIAQLPAVMSAPPLSKRLRKMIRSLQAELDQVAIDRLRLPNQLQGDELNLDAWIDYLGHENLSLHPQHFFNQTQRRLRDVSTLILADVSLSTEAGVTQEMRVIDVLQESLVLLSETLNRLKDAFSIYAFSSIKNKKVHFYLVKNFKEVYSETIRARISAIKPSYYTRMGAAIRHSGQLLAKQKTNNKLLLIISDGKPNDIDCYDGRYGIEDTKKAIEEVKKLGIRPFCITIDVDAKSYLPYLFGKDGYTVIRNAKKLSTLLPKIYMSLT